MTARVKLHQIISLLAGRSHTNVCVHGEKVRTEIQRSPDTRIILEGRDFFYVLKAHNLLSIVLGSTLTIPTLDVSKVEVCL